MTKAEFLKLPMDERRAILEECCTPEIVKHYEVTCPECGNYYGGHATGGHDICDCHERKSSNDQAEARLPDSAASATKKI